MKKVLALCLALVLATGVSGCKNQKQPETGESPETGAAAQIMAETTENDFTITLYADKSEYTADEVIQIWATLEYVGEQDTFTIWHGDPYIVFTITDGAAFNSNGFVHDILTSTELKKGALYHFDYVKSGGWDPQGPDAEFWENFYREKDLKLPAGTYTVSVSGEFHLSEQVMSSPKGPSCKLQITVT